MQQPLVLGSSSPFRSELLQRLGLPFSTHSPDADETRRSGESPAQLVERLAGVKADAVAVHHPQALIIGSDQVACLDGEILGKPGDHANAVAQLTRTSGKSVTFFTGLCLLNAASGNRQSLVETFTVHFRELSLAQIERYVSREQPFNCAGSFKSEGLGITLFRRLEGDDPNALIGLPMIRLVDMLAAEGVEIP